MLITSTYPGPHQQDHVKIHPIYLILHITPGLPHQPSTVLSHTEFSVASWSVLIPMSTSSSESEGPLATHRTKFQWQKNIIAIQWADYIIQVKYLSLSQGEAHVIYASLQPLTWSTLAP
jgi:hypothetical protein